MASTTEELRLIIKSEMAAALQDLASLKKATAEISKNNSGMIRSFSDVKDAVTSGMEIFGKFSEIYKGILEQSGKYREELHQMSERMGLFKTAVARPMADALYDIFGKTKATRNEIANFGTLVGQIGAGIVKMVFSWVKAFYELSSAPLTAIKFLKENVKALFDSEKGWVSWGKAKDKALIGDGGSFFKDFEEQMKRKNTMQRTYSDEEIRMFHRLDKSKMELLQQYTSFGSSELDKQLADVKKKSDEMIEQYKYLAHKRRKLDVTESEFRKVLEEKTQAEKLRVTTDYKNKVKNEIEQVQANISTSYDSELKKRQASLSADLENQRKQIDKLYKDREISYKQFLDMKQQLTESAAKRRTETDIQYYTQVGTQVVNYTQQFTGQLSQIFSQYFNNQNIALDNWAKKQKKVLDKNYNQQKDAIKKSNKSEEEKAALQKKLDDDNAANQQALQDQIDAKKLELAIKQAKVQKAMNIVSTIQSGAVATMQAYAQLGPIGGSIAASVIGSLTGTLVGLIASQPLPKAEKGGFIPGSPGGTQLIAGENNKGEAIIPLENSGVMDKLGGGKTENHFHFEGAIFATEKWPQDVIKQVDKGLYELKRQNKSRLASSI